MGEELLEGYPSIEAPCPIYDECGGCSYLHLRYEDELQLKSEALARVFSHHGIDARSSMEAAVPSPSDLHHRTKISLQMRHLKDGTVLLGFCPYGSKSILPYTRCAIAGAAIDASVAGILEDLKNRDLTKYRRASVEIRQDDTGRVRWGGVGRRSLALPEAEALEFHFENFVLKYELTTFFQSNTAILPALIERLRQELQLQPEDRFLDLYGGVGLFAVTLGHACQELHLIELDPHSVKYAHINKRINGLDHLRIDEGKLEDLLDLLVSDGDRRTVAMIDPPRAGLHHHVVTTLAENPPDLLAYLSCNPETQARDLKGLLAPEGPYRLRTIIPYDFFPKSYHLECLVILDKET